MRAAYSVIPALDNLTFWDKITLRYSLDVVLIGSTGSGLLSSTLAVSPAPVGVAEEDTTEKSIEKSIVQIGDVVDGRR